MTSEELHAHFNHLLGGHATDVDARLGDVDAKLTDALDKMDGLEAAFNSKLDAKFQEVLSRLPPPRDNVRRRARRVPRVEVPAGTAPAAAAAPDAPSDEGYEDYGGDEDKRVDENVLDDEEVEQPSPGHPRQLNRNAHPPPRPYILDYQEYNTITRLFFLACKAEREVQDRQPPWRRANISAGRTSSWSPRQSTPPSRGAASAPTTSKYTAPASRAPPAATPPPSAGPPRSSSSMASTGKMRDIQCRKCLGFGHIERECRTKRVMLVREDGEYDSASDFDEDTLALIVAHDGTNSDSEKEMEVMEADNADQYNNLVAQRVLSVQLSKSEHDQRHNMFQTRGIVKERAIRIIIDGGSCNNLASVDMVEKLSHLRDSAHIHITFNGLRSLGSLRYVEHQDPGEDDTPWSREGEEQLVEKMPKKLDPKTIEELEERRDAGRPRTRLTGPQTGASGPRPGQPVANRASYRAPTGQELRRFRLATGRPAPRPDPPAPGPV
ncbi:hypothetical protein QYE76_066821 [Lolium multiflorum]|uniref:Gag-pol polyprotein n=1 Tax=Lolium multiflorum TaxID=4521 RepID=A0AAD8SCV8_LOLMU|nr:hypothetical protein QYE76_066821 [Lolium multiflorum]